MISADPLERPETCACSWIMGYGVDDDRPTEWVERILVVEEGCPDHGEQTGSSDPGGRGAEGVSLLVDSAAS